MKIYNSLTKKIEEFKTKDAKKLSIYVCGITPYDTTHIGHAFTYLSFDLFLRVLKIKGYSINYTQNVTDINDRDNDILKRAKEQGKTWKELTDYWTKLFLEDMNYLNWIKPNNYLFASSNIKVMVELIEKLVNKDLAYVVNKSVYLNIKKVDQYGKLCGYSDEKMLEIANNFEEDIKSPDKINPLDITLWRAKDNKQQEHIPCFESVFGLGRPGWHLECSAMAINSLGEQIDVHGGGKDLIYPHHEAEIAQSEGATGKKPFAKTWMHTGQVYLKQEKMSKSLGNLVMISNLKQKYSSNALRLMLLSNHYRSDWEYTDEKMINAEQNMNKIVEYLKTNTNSNLNLKDKIIDLLEDDLNMPKVIELILENIGEFNTYEVEKLLTDLGFVFN